jgi:hypothetical protein
MLVKKTYCLILLGHVSRLSPVSEKMREMKEMKEMREMRLGERAPWDGRDA